MLSKYHRQEILQGFGTEGQRKLSSSAVLVIGAGGLGCPLLQYLVAMGIGRVGIIDGDVVSESNLHRQVLFTQVDINRKKVDVAYEVLSKINKDVIIEAFPQYIDQATCLNLIPSYDIIADCSDNFSTRYMVNDACVLLGKPLAFAAVSRYEGQVALFNVHVGSLASGNYRDLFPMMPTSSEVLNCAEAGILGVMAGTIGLLQAIEVVKFLTQIGESLVNKILYYNMLDHQSLIVEYSPNQDTKSFIPSTPQAFLDCIYQEVCEDIDVKEITSSELFDDNLQDYTIVDVRGDFELPKWTMSDYLAIELKDLHRRIDDLPDGKILFICQAGVRSIEAAKIASHYFNDSSRFYSLKGGMLKLPQSINN